MKITYLVPDAHSLGGTASAIVTQANAMSRSHEVQIISIYRLSEESHFPIAPGVQVRDLVTVAADGGILMRRPGLLAAPVSASLHGKPSLLIPSAWDPTLDALADVGLEDALPLVDADVLVTVSPALLAAACQLVPANTAIVHQEHRSSSQRTSGMEPLLAFAPRADVIAMLTESMASWLSGRLGPAAPEIVVVPNALPPGYRPRSRLDNPVIVAAGRLVAEKQYVQLVSAFARISDRIPHWRLRIFGEGTARFDVMGTIRAHRLYDRVELPGSTDDLSSEWASASISALTSTSEGFPLVIQEAMAAGVPVVSYDCPSGPRAIIDHDVNGFLVAQGSEEGMAAALLRLATDPSLRSRLGAAALESASTWDIDAITARWITIFEGALERRRDLGGSRTARRLIWAAAQLGAGAPKHPDEAPVGADGGGLTPAQALRTALQHAVQAAAAVSSDWFVIPPHGEGTPVVVIPTSERGRFLDALVGGGVPDFLSILDPEGRGWPGRRGAVAEMADHLRHGMSPAIVLEPWPRVAGAPGLLGHGCSVQVQFWDDDVEGNLHTKTANRYAQHVPRGAATSSTQVAGVQVPTIPVMLDPTVEEVMFPVDVVYTWVDSADEAWNRAREQRLADVRQETMLSRAASGLARFASHEELRYSLRSLHLFAPWVRTIHLVTAGQVPRWLAADDPRIRIVDHRDILPADALPTFNSQAIETALHRVPDLAEHFVYFNDDVFLGRPVGPERFFRSAGHFAVFPATTLVGLPGQGDLPFLRSAGNNRRLLHEAFGVTTTHNMAHTPHPQRRSVLEEISRRFGADVEATARAPFRSDTDVSMLSSLAQHYGLITGTAYVGDLDHAFANLSNHDVKRRLARLLLREQDTFCLGDHHDYAIAPAKVDRLLVDFFESYYPVAAPWELA